MSKILLAGASGLVGSNLIKKIKQKNLEFVLLSTQKKICNNQDILYWNPEKKEFPLVDLSQFSACINLCGAGILDKNFSNERKKTLRDSRIIPIKFLQEQYKNQNIQCPHFISASAIGIYPNVCLNELNEDSTHGNEFISHLVEDWERAALEFLPDAKHLSIVRIGLVMSKDGGFLDKIVQPMRIFAGAIPGNGQQICSWIHTDDLSELFLFLCENKIDGIYNAVAPEPKTMANICTEIAQQIKRPILLPNIPIWALRLIFGKERHQLLISSQQVSSSKIQSKGFEFSYKNSLDAIKNLLNND